MAYYLKQLTVVHFSTSPCYLILKHYCYVTFVWPWEKILQTNLSKYYESVGNCREIAKKNPLWQCVCIMKRILHNSCGHKKKIHTFATLPLRQCSFHSNKKFQSSRNLLRTSIYSSIVKSDDAINLAFKCCNSRYNIHLPLRNSL